MNGRPWPDRELGELVRLRAAGLTCEEIARRIGRPVGAVHSRLSALRVYKPFARPMASHPMRDALCRPHSLEGVAKAFGKTRAAVVSIKWRLREAGFAVYEIPKKRKENGQWTGY